MIFFSLTLLSNKIVCLLKICNAFVAKVDLQQWLIVNRILRHSCCILFLCKPSSTKFRLEKERLRKGSRTMSRHPRSGQPKKGRSIHFFVGKIYCSVLFRWEFFIRASCLLLSFYQKRGATESGWVQNRPFSFEWKALIWIGRHCILQCDCPP